MAYTDPYATAAEYRARVDQDGTGEDTEITAVLTAVSRFLERKLGRDDDHPRIFRPTESAEARYFDGDGSRTLWLRDDLVSVSGANIKIDENYDGTFETAISLAAPVCVGLPYNAGTGPEPRPFEALELLSYTTNTTITRWPPRRRVVEITGIWGWASVPDAIRETVIMVTRQLRDLQESGFTLSLANLDAAVQAAPGAAALIKQLETRYSARVAAIG